MESEKLFRSRVDVAAELREVDKALAELTARKGHLESRLSSIGVREAELKTSVAALDAKLKSIGDVSEGFEHRVKSIKGAPVAGDDPLASPPGRSGGAVFARASSAEPTPGVSSYDAETGTLRVLSPLGLARDGRATSGIDMCTRTFYGHSASVAAVCYEPVRGKVFSGSSDATVRMWNIDSGVCERSFLGHTGWVRALQASGEVVVSGSGDKTVRVFELTTGVQKLLLAGHNGSVSSLQFEGSTLVTGSLDKTARVWDMEAGAEVLALRGHDSYIADLQFWQYGLATASGDATIKFWDIRTGECHRTLTGHAGGVLTLGFDASYLYTGGTDKVLAAWDLRMGSMAASVALPGGVQSLAFAGQTLVAAAGSPVVHVFDRESLTETGLLRGHVNTVKSLHMGAGGLVVSGGADANVKTWQV
ncbi:WD40 repeat protein [Thecamonas trahens ATCC 50062]|uniref:WD40 repeat protein n=1 Tax=Thecamonas trahens ATCC 50062 TaxID=461836 RepID=A0A0L0DAD9_THETB|nr:WD40 repeat protein [Thecamonas trahens ATCC 50062]KNC49307.1 WD40 repeat protein [Thecamonas trahens ATCC 50062]|eukprot:XP_013758017.1 WD40 repeat protein [Thecamonas trahens ATCC 50062]